MEEKDVRAIFEQMYAQEATRYGVAKVPVHRHNGIDTVQIEYQDILNRPGELYGGKVNDNGDAIYLPAGWTSTRTGTGEYTVTHNLGTTAYAVLLTGIGNGFYTLADEPTSTLFEYQYFEPSGSAGDRVVYFLLKML